MTMNETSVPGSRSKLNGARRVARVSADGGNAMAHSIDLPELTRDSAASDVAFAVEFMIKSLIQESGDAWLDEDFNWKLCVVDGDLIAESAEGKQYRIEAKAR